MPFKGFTYCFECPVQTQCPGTGNTNYAVCALNSGWAAPGSALCTSCSVNNECFVGYEVPCQENYYSDVGDFECHPCPEGKSCTPGAQNSQVTCGAGTYSPAGSMECYTCPIGHMCPDTKMSKPIPCPAGTDQVSTGQTSCNTCADGTYSNIPGTASCLTLPTGHHGGTFKTASLP